jgi:hypothetical protein
MTVTPFALGELVLAEDILLLLLIRGGKARTGSEPSLFAPGDVGCVDVLRTACILLGELLRSRCCC